MGGAFWAPPTSMLGFWLAWSCADLVLIVKTVVRSCWYDSLAMLGDHCFSPPISGSYSLSAPSSVMISETWFCVCDTVVPSGAECSTLTYFLRFEIHKDEEEHFWDTWGLYAIQNPAPIKQSLTRILPSSFVICCLGLLLYSIAELNNWQTPSDPYSTYHLSYYGKSQLVLDLVGQSERQITQFSVRPHRAETSLWISMSFPPLFSPTSLLPLCSCLLSCYSTFPLFSWPRKVLEAIGCWHLCLSLTAPYSRLSCSQGLWSPSLLLGHCSVVILVSSRLSISLDSMYFLFCIILTCFLFSAWRWLPPHTFHCVSGPRNAAQSQHKKRSSLLYFQVQMVLKRICSMKGYKILRWDLYSFGTLKVLPTCLRRGSGEPHTFSLLLLCWDCFSLFESTMGMPFLAALPPALGMSWYPACSLISLSPTSLYIWDWLICLRLGCPSSEELCLLLENF